MNVKGRQITATNLPLVPMNGETTLVLVSKGTSEMALTAITVMQVNFFF